MQFTSLQFLKFATYQTCFASRIKNGLPYRLWEQHEPCYIKYNCTEEKHCIGSPKALAAALDRDKRKKGHHKIDQQHTIEQRTEWSNQSTTNLDKNSSNKLKSHIELHHN